MALVRVTKRTRKPRMIASVSGGEREGKSNFALTAPGPTAIAPFDNNTWEIIDKFRAIKPILVPSVPLNYSRIVDADECKALWTAYEEFIKEAAETAAIRSIITDTGTDAHTLIRMALLGKLSGVPERLYDDINMAMSKLVDILYQTDKNIIWTHQWKEEYRGNKGTGNLIPAGWSRITKKVQINMRVWRDLDTREPDPDNEGAFLTMGFGATIENCTQRPELANTYIQEPNCDWPTLGMLVYPDTTLEDWQ